MDPCERRALWSQPGLPGVGSVRLDVRVTVLDGAPLAAVSYTVVNADDGSWIAAVVYPPVDHRDIASVAHRALLEGTEALQLYISPF